MSAPAYDPIAVARQFCFVREAQENGQNHGLRVNAIQIWSGGQDGDSYCCEFVWMVLDIAFQGSSPFADRQQACADVYALAAKNGWVTTTPSVGDLFFYRDETGHAHHIGFVSAANPASPTGWNAIAGNTSGDGTSSNGDGVHEHALLPPSPGSIGYAAYPRT